MTRDDVSRTFRQSARVEEALSCSSTKGFGPGRESLFTTGGGALFRDSKEEWTGAQNKSECRGSKSERRPKSEDPRSEAWPHCERERLILFRKSFLVRLLMRPSPDWD